MMVDTTELDMLMLVLVSVALFRGHGRATRQ